MDIVNIMREHGFGASSSGGGCEWYTKETVYKGKSAFIAITDNGGLDLPQSLDEPVYVGIYDLDTGDLIEEAKLHDSLKSYLDSISS